MGKIKLFINEYYLGNFYVIEDEYIYEPNEVGVLLAKRDYPLQMRTYTLGHESLLEMDVMPEPFLTFYNYSFRQDLIEKANIEDHDTPFNRIYKLAGLELLTGNFTIKQL